MANGEEEVCWEWDGKPIRLGLTRLGAGRRILLLPAPSSISTRRELLPLQDRLAGEFETISIDWPGFGDLPRPAIAWSPEAFSAFLDHVLRQVASDLHAILGAGHAAGYLLSNPLVREGSAGRLGFLAPTWRGPLPTMSGRRLPLFKSIAVAADRPIAGEALYRANVNGPMIRMMVGGHVYADPGRLTPEWMAEKRRVTGAAGARHASLRFVTGELDRFRDREAFLEAARSCRAPIHVLYAAGTPRKSQDEMLTLAGVPGISSTVLPRGKLSVYEEFPDQTAAALLPFLNPSHQPVT